MRQFNKKIRSKFVLWIYGLALLAIACLFYFDWIVGVLFLLLFITLYMYDIKEEREIRQLRIQHLQQLTTQVEKAGETVFLGLPIGIVLYNEAFEIEWVNPYMRKLLGHDEWREQSLAIICESLPQVLEEDDVETDCRFESIHFDVLIDRSNQALFFFDATEEKALRQRYEEEKLVLAVVYLDNYEEISRNMDDNLKSRFNSMVTSALNKWAEENEFYMKRTSQDRFFAVLTENTLQRLEETKFDILDEIRQLRVDKTQRNPITLSIGVGTGTESPTELAQLSQSALDLALGRGGDQVAIRDENGKVRFYGGQTNPMEKHTRVRARVISHALAELVKESDNVLIMGHKRPDMDAIGAALGVLHIAQANDVEGYIVFDERDMTIGIEKLIAEIKKDEKLWKYFVRPEEAEDLYTGRSLVVVVDTNRPSLVAHEALLHRAEHKVVIDHHRRGEDFVDQPTLVYIEPYASSTSELVTELIEYQPKQKELTAIIATALLAGIIVDTKSFALRTGSRTFDAASYLRLKGADSVRIQQFLKEDLETVIKRNKLIERAYMYHDAIAIIVADEQWYDQVLIAQTADELLTIDQVKAAFVIAYRDENTIGISARSLGDINVQLIMEQLDGGGHLTNAATQLKDIGLEEAETLLQEKITNYLEERN